MGPDAVVNGGVKVAPPFPPKSPCALPRRGAKRNKTTKSKINIFCLFLLLLTGIYVRLIVGVALFAALTPTYALSCGEIFFKLSGLRIGWNPMEGTVERCEDGSKVPLSSLWSDGDGPALIIWTRNCA